MAKLRWYQIRLRAVIIAMTLAGVVFGVWAANVRPYLRQARAKKDITNAGGIVESRSGPKWLASVLGDEKCQDITLVDLADIVPSRELLDEIATLASLEVLIVGGAGIDDALVDRVPTCASLQAVVLDSTNVSHEGINRLRARYPQVQILRSDRQIANGFSHGPFFARTAATFSTDNVPDKVLERIPKKYHVQIEALQCGNRERFSSRPDVTNGELSRLHSLRVLHLGEVQEFNPQQTQAILDNPFTLDAISELDQLEVLGLAGFPITDASLAGLSKLKKLRSLDLRHTLVSDPAIWPDWPLESLLLDKTFLEDDDMPALARYEGLKILWLNHTEVTDAGLHSLKPLSQLTRLQLRGDLITDDSYETLCQFPTLEKISLGIVSFVENKTRDTTRWITPLGPRVLSGEPWSWDEESLRPDAKLAEQDRQLFAEQIKNAVKTDGSLYVDVADALRWFHVDLLAGQAGITSVSAPLMTDEDLEVIATLPDLESLSMGESRVTDEGLRHLARCGCLKNLSLSGTAITDQGMEHIARIKTLERLTIPPQAIGAAGFRHLMNLPKLRFLHFYGFSQVRAARQRAAPGLSARDIEQLGALAKLISARFDRDGDGVTLRSEIDEYWNSSRASGALAYHNDYSLFPGFGRAGAQADDEFPVAHLLREWTSRQVLLPEARHQAGVVLGFPESIFESR